MYELLFPNEKEVWLAFGLMSLIIVGLIYVAYRYLSFQGVALWAFTLLLGAAIIFVNAKILDEGAYLTTWP